MSKSSRGMTLSSFGSVTLSPEPIITFNIRCPSSTLQSIAYCTRFLIHILDASAEGARIADVFTKGNGREEISAPLAPFERGVRSGIFDLEAEIVTAEMGNEKKQVALPRLSGKGIGKVLRCELINALETGQPRNLDSYGAFMPRKGLIGIGDHVLVLARVVEILDRPKSDVEEETKYGLSYVDGTYRQAGDAISPKDERAIEDLVEEGKK
jgi:flavin reductase (DIM6/NTAB) family NADH-FMN oxidoreductase RutF